MKEIIKNIYYGNICFSDRNIEETENYQTARKIAVKALETFEAKLSCELKHELDEYLSHESDLNAFIIEQAFIDGFKLGAHLTAEISDFDINKSFI